MCTKWRCLRIGVSFHSLPQCQAHLLIFPSPALPPRTSGLCGIRCRRSTVEELLPATASSTALWMMVSKAYLECFCSWHHSSFYNLPPRSLETVHRFDVCILSPHIRQHIFCWSWRQRDPVHTERTAAKPDLPTEDSSRNCGWLWGSLRVGPAPDVSPLQPQRSQRW